MNTDDSTSSVILSVAAVAAIRRLLVAITNDNTTGLTMRQWADMRLALKALGEDATADTITTAAAGGHR